MSAKKKLIYKKFYKEHFLKFMLALLLRQILEHKKAVTNRKTNTQRRKFSFEKS